MTNCCAEYLKDDPAPTEEDENKEKRTDDISSWDADFLKVDQGTLFELILVSFPVNHQSSAGLHKYTALACVNVKFYKIITELLPLHYTCRLRTTWISRDFWMSPVKP